MAIMKVDVKACTGCGTCEKVCPMDVIRMNQNNQPEIRYPQDCITCFNCEVDCPTQAIVVGPERQHPSAIPIVLPW
jgi:NAD-dependent dihydropyrimidine dehydrogenase PreA subunit